MRSPCVEEVDPLRSLTETEGWVCLIMEEGKVADDGREEGRDELSRPTSPRVFWRMVVSGPDGSQSILPEVSGLEKGVLADSGADAVVFGVALEDVGEDAVDVMLSMDVRKVSPCGWVYEFSCVELGPGLVALTVAELPPDHHVVKTLIDDRLSLEASLLVVAACSILSGIAVGGEDSCVAVGVESAD